MVDLLIVARSQPDLYAYLKHDFNEDGDVRVIQDRRLGERRQTPGLTSQDRRRADRRTNPDLGAKLTAVGFAVIQQAQD